MNNADDTQWLIWSHEHTAWWGPNERGYVRKRKDTGRYYFEHAKRIVAQANIGQQEAPNEAMVLEEE